MTGLELIAVERKRQIEVEGFDARHDAGHIKTDLSRAAACYALSDHHFINYWLTTVWPWGRSWWKPKDRISDLARAGALIAAAIDQIQENP